MRRRFSGIWATFEYLDDVLGAIAELKEAGLRRLIVHTPCPRPEIDQALGNPQSPVPYATLIGAFIGFGTIVGVVTKMTLDWILPVSGKPILGVPSIAPVVFVFSILIAVYFTIGGIFLLIIRDMRRHPLPQSRHYKEYNRFMRDRFGIVVPCAGEELDRAAGILKKFGAEEVNIEE